MSSKLPFRCLPLVEWPTADREAWLEAVRSADLLDTSGPFGRLPEVMKRDLPSAYGRWLGFLGDDLPSGLGTSGLDVMNRETLSGFIDLLKTFLAPHSVAACITYLERVARAMPTDRDISFLRHAATNLRRLARPALEPRLHRHQPTPRTPWTRLLAGVPVIRTFISTAKKQGWNVIQALMENPEILIPRLRTA